MERVLSREELHRVLSRASGPGCRGHFARESRRQAQTKIDTVLSATALGLAWVVNPGDRTVSVYTCVEQVEILGATDQLGEAHYAWLRLSAQGIVRDFGRVRSPCGSGLSLGF